MTMSTMNRSRGSPPFSVPVRAPNGRGAIAIVGLATSVDDATSAHPISAGVGGIPYIRNVWRPKRLDDELKLMHQLYII